MRRSKPQHGLAGAATALASQLNAKSRGRREALTRSAPAGVKRNDLMPALDLVTLPLDQIQAPARQVRRLDPAHVRDIARSVASLGFSCPLLVDPHNQVLDGVARLEAARQLGLATLPCVRVGHLTEAESRVLRLAVNRLGETGAWDLDELRVELSELVMTEAPIEIAGFSPDEIDHIMLVDDDDDAEPGDPEPREAPAIARVGDCFALGAHRLVCGDATNAEVMQVLMGSDQARLVLTDEPYNVPIAGHVTSGRHREFAMASGEMTDEQFRGFNAAWMALASAHLCDGGVLATFIDWRGYATVAAAATSLGLDPLNLVVWAKTNAGMGSLYRSQHELLPLFKKGQAAHVNNVRLGAKGRWRSNLWTYPGASSLGSDARRGLKEHPTVKPVVMLEDALLDLTHRGEMVLDPFLGSGSTLLAAERTGRVCRGIEVDPRYVDVIVRRYEAVTGQAATLTETGETFHTLARLRGVDAAPPPGS